jgi:hypothetical protein
MTVTVAIRTLGFKHLFEESWILSGGWGRKSYRCSIERTFDQEDQMSTMTIGAATWTRPTGRVRAATPVRLTRRGRLLVVALLTGLALGLLLLATAHATATSDRGTSPVADRVTVRSGETLWAIAERIRPDADPRATIERIRDMNALDAGGPQAGQVLLVPAGR